MTTKIFKEQTGFLKEKGISFTEQADRTGVSVDEFTRYRLRAKAIPLAIISKFQKGFEEELKGFEPEKTSEDENRLLKLLGRKELALVEKEEIIDTLVETIGAAIMYLLKDEKETEETKAIVGEFNRIMAQLNRDDLKI